MKYWASVSSESSCERCSCSFLMIFTNEPSLPCLGCGRAIYCIDGCLRPIGPWVTLEKEVYSEYREPSQCDSLLDDTSFSECDQIEPLIGSCLESGENVLRIEKFLGKGNFGDVYEVADSKEGIRFAAKALMNRAVERFQWMKSELRVMAALHGDRTGSFPDVKFILEREHHEFIVMELLTISLRERFQYLPPSLPQIRVVLAQMLSALVRLRQLRICHFDVELKNIMLAPNGRVKLIDFSCAQFDRDLNPRMFVCTTSFIRAPELILRYRVSNEADMWSLGVAMLKLYLHRTPCFAAVEHLLHEHHEWYMLTSLQKTFGPIPDHLIRESAGRDQYYSKSAGGRYSLLKYEDSHKVKGCNVRTVIPYFVAERADCNHKRDERNRKNFLDLIAKIFVYERRISPEDALRHRFFKVR